MTFYKAMFMLPFLAACGGGTATSLIEEPVVQTPPVAQEPPVVEVTPPTAAELQALIYEIDSRATAEDPFTTSTMPRFGTATFKGGVEYKDDQGNPEVYSAATLTANFANDSMEGVLDNFVSYGDEIRVPGQVTLVNGMIDGHDYMAELEGALTVEGVVVNVWGDLGGSFYREDASLIGGRVRLTDGDYVSYGALVAEE